MRLQSLIPTIPSDLVAVLEACGIRTDADILFSGTPIDILQRLPPGVISLADLKPYIALVAESASARGISGDELYTEELQRRHAHDMDITCGVEELDALVNGFGGGRVLEISGDRGSGKTLLVSQVALRLLAAYKEASVLWMDTTGDFSAERTGRIAQELFGEGSSTVLERIQVSLVLDIETARALLEDLESSLSASTLPSPRVRLVIIDSVTSLLAPSLSAVSSHGHAIMTTFMQHLRSMARSYYLAFLVSVYTSHMASSNSLEVVNNTAGSPQNPLSTTRKPALGPSFTFLTDCTIWLARQDTATNADAGSSIHVAEILRSRSTRSRTWCTFKIQNGVLRPAT
ncbi:P-loop containing nucleoside triphosphate hydrolase protein [Boletus coccyginus]|nr:P-loop containing nucleoside triphosphate hydrolase protein [Boletus coccyginus]